MHLLMWIVRIRMFQCRVKHDSVINGGGVAQLFVCAANYNDINSN